MVRAPAHALPRPTGFALLKPASKPQLNSTRIFTLSTTLALNLLALGVLMMPMSLPIPTAEPAIRTNPQLREIPKKPEVIEFVPVKLPQPPVTPAAPVEHPRIQAPAVSQPAPAVISDTGSEAAAPSTTASSDTGPITGPVAGPDIGPAPMQLAYRVAPAPDYPRNALRRQFSGTVLLQVLVDVDGRPLEVSIARSSGHRELDDAARQQVLKRWSFQPAFLDGRPVQAVGMVPIEFNLRR